MDATGTTRPTAVNAEPRIRGRRTDPGEPSPSHAHSYPHTHVHTHTHTDAHAHAHADTGRGRRHFGERAQLA
jgi:hypothetical protein